MINSYEDDIDFNPKTINLFLAMRSIDISWKMVSNNTIQNCFTKAKFKFNRTTTQIEIASEESEPDFWQHLKRFTNVEFESFKTYVEFDDIECEDREYELNDEEIIQTVYENQEKHETFPFLEEVEENKEQETQPISRSQALSHINELQKFFCQIGDNSFNVHFNAMHRKITDTTFKNLRQTKISDFFA
jgi:hypothetical protein